MQMMTAISKEKRERIVQASNWRPTYEQSKSERVLEISFGPLREFKKSFVSAANAKFFSDYLFSLGISHDITEYSFDDYGKLR